ncbi:molybdenum cofactor biosynthesis protein MoaE [Boudabousia tangfeifanii]|uniref:molybdenum cofactor biosynthesis protein MoaE n=1 Tax=Boudabousia tangfeifanii TaxID=1912795 RepID=UPI001F301B07|nr:molybdenum cofactor biosynthesis protein MoaE [Boudabousia tangfeifanii]
MTNAEIAAKVREATISDQPLDLDAATAAVNDPRAGAIATFFGQVRNHDHGDEVTFLEYSMHPTAEAEIKQIAAEIAARDELCAVWVAHRVGTLQIGDAALVAAVSAPHRQAAFQALADIVDEVKSRVPIWKCQHFPDGSHEWSNCP